MGVKYYRVPLYCIVNLEELQKVLKYIYVEAYLNLEEQAIYLKLLHNSNSVYNLIALYLFPQYALKEFEQFEELQWE